MEIILLDFNIMKGEVMDIFDNISKKANDTCKFAAKQKNRMVQIAKLKLFISRSRDEIHDIYQDIGKAVYQKHLEGEEIDGKYIQDCIEIDTIANEIENARLKILELNDLRQCQSCYSEVDREFKFCPSCGVRLDDENIGSVLNEDENNTDVDNNKEKCECGCENDINSSFCTECGNKLK